MISLIKKDITNPSNGADNDSASSETSESTKVTTSNPALNSAQDPENRDYLDRRSLPWIKGIWSVWDPGTVPSMHIWKETLSNSAADGAMELNVTGRSKSTISRTDLDSCTNVIVVGMNYQIINDAGIT